MGFFTVDFYRTPPPSPGEFSLHVQARCFSRISCSSTSIFSSSTACVGKRARARKGTSVESVPFPPFFFLDVCCMCGTCVTELTSPKGKKSKTHYEIESLIYCNPGRQILLENNTRPRNLDHPTFFPLLNLYFDIMCTLLNFLSLRNNMLNCVLSVFIPSFATATLSFHEFIPSRMVFVLSLRKKMLK